MAIVAKAITRTAAAVCGHSGVMLPPGLMEVSSHHNSLCRLSGPKQTVSHQHCCTSAEDRGWSIPQFEQTVKSPALVNAPRCSSAWLRGTAAEVNLLQQRQERERERGLREAPPSNRMNGLEIGANQGQGAGIKAESRFNPQQQQNRTRIRAHPAH